MRNSELGRNGGEVGCGSNVGFGGDLRARGPEAMRNWECVSRLEAASNAEFGMRNAELNGYGREIRRSSNFRFGDNLGAREWGVRCWLEPKGA